MPFLRGPFLGPAAAILAKMLLFRCLHSPGEIGSWRFLAPILPFGVSLSQHSPHRHFRLTSAVSILPAVDLRLCLYCSSYYSHFSLGRILLSAQTKAFTSRILALFCSLLGIKGTGAYHFISSSPLSIEGLHPFYMTTYK
jgi:hypothetical protein